MVDLEQQARAIAVIEECRETHVRWAAWQESHEGAGVDWRDRTDPGDVGGPEHHRQWVANYDIVLAVLRGEHFPVQETR